MSGVLCTSRKAMSMTPSTIKNKIVRTRLGILCVGVVPENLALCNTWMLHVKGHPSKECIDWVDEWLKNVFGDRLLFLDESQPYSHVCSFGRITTQEFDTVRMLARTLQRDLEPGKAFMSEKGRP